MLQQLADKLKDVDDVNAIDGIRASQYSFRCSEYADFANTYPMLHRKYYSTVASVEEWIHLLAWSGHEIFRSTVNIFAGTIFFIAQQKRLQGTHTHAK